MFKIGVDIVKVKRIEEAIKKNEKFKEKVFTINEIKYCEQRKNKYESFAARFAAKEAYIKASSQTLGFNEIEILNDNTGKPYIYINNEKVNGDLSLSHTDENAIATYIHFK